MEKTSGSKQFLRVSGIALGMLVLSAASIALGVRRFWIRPEHFGVPALLGCVVGAAGGFFCLLVAEYVLLHARLAFIPWAVTMIYLAFVQPHFAVGMGLALWVMAVSQMRD